MLNYQRVFLFANHMFGGDPVGASPVVATLATLAAAAVADRWVRRSMEPQQKIVGFIDTFGFMMLFFNVFLSITLIDTLMIHLKNVVLICVH
jgi:hypothetical protein